MYCTYVMGQVAEHDLTLERYPIYRYCLYIDLSTSKTYLSVDPSQIIYGMYQVPRYWNFYALPNVALTSAFPARANK